MKKLKKKMIGLALAGALICNLPGVALGAEESGPVFDLEQVIITATKTEKPLKDVPASVSVITAKDLEKINAKSLDDALQYVPGVYLNNQTGMKANKISIRGLSQNRVLVLVDGMPMNQGYTGTSLRDVPLSNIERIEIIKGPFSALYGSSAMGGVINVITKEGGPPQTILKTAVGEQGTHRYTVSHSNTVGKLQYYLDYYKMDTDGYIEPKLPAYGKFSKENEKYSVKMTYRFNDQDKLTVMSSKTESEYGYDDQARKGARTAKENNLQYSHKFDENREIKLQVGEFTVDPYWTLQPMSKRVAGRTVSFPSYSSNPVKIKTGEINYNWKVNENNLLTVGLNTRLDKYDGYSLNKNENTYQDLSGAKARTDSFYLQDEIKMDPKVTLYLGGRYDKWKFYDGYNLQGNMGERTEDNFSPKLALVYKQDERSTWHFSTGKSFAAPNFINNARLWPMGSGTGFLTPSADISPEKSTSYEVGLEKILSPETTLSLNLFQNEISDMIVQSDYNKNGVADGNSYWRNVAKARIKGVELETKHKFSSSLTSFVNYTYNESKILKYENKAYEGNELPTVPKETFNIGLTYDQGKVMADIRGTYISGVYDNEANTTYYEPHFVVNTKLAYRVNENTQLALCVDNLFNKEYYEDNLAPGRIVTLEITQKF